MRYSFFCTTLIALSMSCGLVAKQTSSESPASSADIAQKGCGFSFTTVAKKAIPAVVFIKAEMARGEFDDFAMPDMGRSPFDQYGEDFFNRFFGGPRGRPPQRGNAQLSTGSGFIVSADGYVITNCHVVQGADKITVVLNDGLEMAAKVIGTDSQTDIAVLKVEGSNLPFVAFGDSEAMEVGEWVIAIGSPFRLEATLTVGVVSAKGRQDLKINALEDFIQTDAAINPGNSGGPLLNLRSEVIGVNTAIATTSGGYMGIGFAVPSNIAKHVVDQLMSNGTVTRGFMGVSPQPIDRDIADAFHLDKTEGVLVAEVVKDSPAEKAGIKQGDIIIEYNGRPVKTVGGFRNEISLTSPGTEVKLKINRRGEILTIGVILASNAEMEKSPSVVAGKLGFEVDNLTPDLAQKLGYSAAEGGVVITKVRPGSIGAAAGLRPGILILAVNHKKIGNIDDFHAALSGEGDQKTILILAKQGNLTRFYSIKTE